MYMILDDRLIEEYVSRDRLPSLFEGGAPFPAKVGGEFVLIFGDWKNHEGRITVVTSVGGGYVSLLCGEVRVVGGNILGRTCTLGKPAREAVRKALRRDVSGKSVLVVDPYVSKGAERLLDALPAESALRWKVDLQDEPPILESGIQ